MFKIHHPAIILRNPQSWAKSAEGPSYFLKGVSRGEQGEHGPPSAHSVAQVAVGNRKEELATTADTPQPMERQLSLIGYGHKYSKIVVLNVNVVLKTEHFTAFPQVLPLSKYCNRFLLQLQVKFYLSWTDKAMKLLIVCQVKMNLFACVTCPSGQAGTSSSILGPPHVTSHTLLWTCRNLSSLSLAQHFSCCHGHLDGACKG